MGELIKQMTTCFGQGNDYSACASVNVGTVSTFTTNSSKGFVNEVVDTLSGGVNLVLSGVLQGADENLVKAALAGRCFLTSGATDFWRILAAAYYAMRAFGIANYLIDLLNQYRPSLCACKNMVKDWSAMFGSNAQSTANNLQSCSEAAT